MADRDQDYGRYGGQHEFGRDHDRDEPGHRSDAEQRSWRGRGGGADYDSGYRDEGGRENFGDYRQGGSGGRFAEHQGERSYRGQYGAPYDRQPYVEQRYGAPRSEQETYGGYGPSSSPSFGGPMRGQAPTSYSQVGGWGEPSAQRGAAPRYVGGKTTGPDPHYHASGYEPGSQIWRNERHPMGDFGQHRQEHEFAPQGRREHELHSSYGDFEPDYLHWRTSQMQSFDRDYHQWRQERRTKFARDFDDWRNRQAQQQGQLFQGQATTTQASQGSPGRDHLEHGIQAGGGHPIDVTEGDKSRDDKNNIKKS